MKVNLHKRYELCFMHKFGWFWSYLMRWLKKLISGANKKIHHIQGWKRLTKLNKLNGGTWPWCPKLNWIKFSDNWCPENWTVLNWCQTSLNFEWEDLGSSQTLLALIITSLNLTQTLWFHIHLCHKWPPYQWSELQMTIISVISTPNNIIISSKIYAWNRVRT